ncbi:MAG: M24 family metallopeptidase [Alcanivoracaceae bacterium]|nr:M24 family metallopeptidase [Alcanivoracaceae bacterium]
MSLRIKELAEAELLAKRCTQAIAAILEPGMSEQDAASLMREWLKQQGVTQHLHRPLAWFGQRTALAGRSGWLPRPGIRPDYFPSDISLRDGMAVSLYCAPSIEHKAAESLLCTTIGQNPDYARLTADVAELQTRLHDFVSQSRSIQALEEMMQRFAAGRSLQLAHRRPPVLDWLRPFSISPDTGYADARLVDKLATLTGNPMPAHLPTSQIPLDHASQLTDGLWVIQPWLVRDKRGAGFRSLLHVNNGTVNWLNTDEAPLETLMESA